MNKKIFTAIILMFVAVWSVSCFFIVRYHWDSQRQHELYENLVERVKEGEKIGEDMTCEVPEDGSFLSGYENLYRENPDMVGWIKVEGTNIDYPVMQSTYEPNYYLKHNFAKEYTDYGCPYVQDNCSVTRPSDNIIIYGHHMNGKAMFGALDNYKSEEFWKKHRMITFNTLAEHHEYEILAVFKTVVYTNQPETFRYYHFVDAKNEEEFSMYVEKCKALSLYDTSVTSEYGDKLLTLSTCEYSQKNGRLVVVAKLIK